jgi:hypothetical protein
LPRTTPRLRPWKLLSRRRTACSESVRVFFVFLHLCVSRVSDPFEIYHIGLSMVNM